MSTVRILKLNLKCTPWEFFQGVYALYPTAFFLDSPSYQPPAQRFSYIGWNPAVEISVSGKKMTVTEKGRRRLLPAAQLLTVLRRLMKRYKTAAGKRVPFFLGGAVGFLGYEMAGYFDAIRFRTKPRWGKVPDLHLGIYQELVVYDHQTGSFYAVCQKKAGKIELQIAEILKKRAAVQMTERVFHFSRYRAALKRQDFEKAVRQAKKFIADGDIYQANLSQRFHFDYRGSSLALYGALRRINPSPFSAFYKTGPLEIVSSSPERLVSKRGRLCETKPIAGTRPRQKGRERALARELMTNKKEQAEHLMLVDLERNDLGRVCEWPTVRVNEFMQVEKYSHVMHLVSRITGRLKNGCDVWDLIQAMFPGGTITGCPKIRCMQIIDALEPETRGIYTGSIGYVSFNGDADLNIVIRTLVLKKNRHSRVGTGRASENLMFSDSGRHQCAGTGKASENLTFSDSGQGFYQTGAGIVHDSIPRREYEETLHKGEALKQALKKASTEKV